MAGDAFAPCMQAQGPSSRSPERQLATVTETPGLTTEAEAGVARGDDADSEADGQTLPSTSGTAFQGENVVPTPRLQRLRVITLNFTPSWFSVCMGTGIVSTLLYGLPYSFRGLKVIADIIFGLNAFLFVLFLSLTVARYAIWPRMLPVMLYHPGQSLFLGTLPMAATTLINMCAMSAAPAWGPKMVTFTWVWWWTNAVLSLLICVGLPFLQFTRQKHALEQLTAIWLLPVVATVVQAASGGIVADILSPSHARLTLIVSWILLGTGLSLAFFIMVLYFLRLAIHKIPPAALIVSAFLPLGPCGQGAFALLKLSSTLYKLSNSTGQALSATSVQSSTDAHIIALAIYGASMVAALLLFGLGLVWLIFAVSILLDLWLVSELKFNLGWWGFTFPLGTFASAASQFGQEFDSKAFKVLGTILSVIVTLLWLFISFMTLLKAVKGEIFFSPCLAETGGEPPRSKVPDRRQYNYEPRSEKILPSVFSERGASRSRSRSRSQVRSRPLS